MLDAGKGVTISYEWNDTGELIVHAYLPEGQSAMLVSHYVKVKTTRQQTGPQARLKELEEYFSEMSGIPRPQRVTVRQKKAAAIRWWHPLQDISDLADDDMQVAKRIINESIKRMRQDRLTISAPQSIVNVAIDEFAKSRSGKGIKVW